MNMSRRRALGILAGVVPAVGLRGAGSPDAGGADPRLPPGIEPEEGRWDEKEVEHYGRVVESLHKRNLTPFVTLHHFTNPIWFDEMGGWTSDRAPELLGRYAGYMAKQLGDAVPFWLTINEPPVLPAASYIAGAHPPAKRDMGLAMAASRNILRSLATMHNAIRENAPHKPKIQPFAL